MSPEQLTDQWHTPEKLNKLFRYQQIVAPPNTSNAMWTARRRFWGALIECRSLNFRTAHRLLQFGR